MEKAHDISIDEPTVAHQAILFMLDVLMRNDNQSLSISELYDSFGDKSFTPQMLRAVGGNEQGLKQFLLRYPSLFTVMADTVSANSGNSMRGTPERTYLKRHKSKEDDLNSQNSANIEHDSKTMKEIEQEAIAFFKKQMTKREEDWLPIVSVAGHASQASNDVRKYVGPQNEFKAFLVRYPHVFFVRDEFCGLKGRADVSTQPFPPVSPPPKRRIGLNRTHSFKNRYSTCSMTSGSNVNLPNLGAPLGMSSGPGMSMQQFPQQQQLQQQQQQPLQQKPRLTPIEVKAVHYVMRVLHKQGRMLLQNIPGLISRAPDHVSNVIGFTREDLIQFFKRHSAIFQLHPDGCVSVKQDAIKALILKDRSFCDSSIFTNSGTVLRIFPKYGILNLDNNEQVFFDIQSCLFETYADLTTILHPGDRLYFNAVIGPRDGSTKWRSLKTWIKTKDQNNLLGDSVSSDAGKSDDSSSNGCNNSVHSLNGSTHSNPFNQQNGHQTTNSTTTTTTSPAQHHQFQPQQQLQQHQHNNMYLSTQSSTTNSNLEEDFNQYQLDGDFVDDNDLGTLKNSSSMNNLNQNSSNINNQIGKIDESLGQLSITSSNSLPTIAPNQSLSPSSATKLGVKSIEQVNTTPIVQPQRLLTEAADNISKREVCSTNSHLVNVGCQTVSTGDIMATNVYIA